MRGLLRDFAARGGTVLLSSHLLHEVETIADRLVVIGNGQIVADGGKDELLSASGTLVRAGDQAALRHALTSAGLPHAGTADGALLVDAGAEAIGLVAAAASIALLELRTADGKRLEEMYLTLTSASTSKDAA
jgi:ABC-2 type transport system ATP-binding protein